MPTFQTQHRIPSLDGLRAISISIVIFSHLLSHHETQFPILNWINVWIFGNGGLGVSVFFVISGFLITLLMKKEEISAHQVNIRNFYIRRAFRILPAFLTFMFVMFILVQNQWIQVGKNQYFSALFFFYNYMTFHPDFYIGHCWSLSLEEQFYLFWPILFSVFRSKKSSQIAFWMIVLSPLIRVLSYYALPQPYRGKMPVMLHTRLDTLMLGCLAGIHYGTPELKIFFDKIFKIRLQYFALGVLICISPFLKWTLGGKYIGLLQSTFDSLAITILVIGCVLYPGTKIGRFLNTKYITHLGVISYSLYLWQQLFMIENKHYLFLTQFPVNILAALSCAHLSYYWIEQPFLRWRQRWIHSPSL